MGALTLTISYGQLSLPFFNSQIYFVVVVIVVVAATAAAAVVVVVVVVVVFFLRSPKLTLIQSY